MRGVFQYNNKTNLTDITELGIPLETISISVQSCRLVDIPQDFFMKFTFLESLNLQNNCIANHFDLPSNVTYLNLSYNKLTTFVYNAVTNRRLEYLDIKYNLIPTIPVAPGVIIRYTGNNREYDRINAMDVLDVNNLRGAGARVGGGGGGNMQQQIIEATNVHESVIQSNTHKSIDYLLSSFKDERKFDPAYYKYDYNYCIGILEIYGEIIQEELREFKPDLRGLVMNYRKLLNDYNEITTTITYDYGNYKNCTMSDILERIWTFAKNKTKEDKKSIICNLFIQMQDGYDHCFVGKFTRVVSSLVSFDNGIQLEISFPIRFGNAIDFMKKKGTYNKENLIKFVEDSELSDNEKRTWNNNINDIFDE